MIWLVKLIDRYLGTPICLLLQLLKSVKSGKKDVKKVLVIMFWGIGSNINSLPAVRALKLKYPKAEMTVLAPKGNKAVFYNLDFIDHTFFLGLSPFSVLWFVVKNMQRFDVAVDMEHYLNISAIIGFLTSRRVYGFGNTRRKVLYDDSIDFDPSLHSVDNNLNLAKLAGAEHKADRLERLNFRAEDKAAVESLLKEYQIRHNDTIIGICPGSGPTMVQRRWMPDRFAQLADIIVEKYNAKVILVGSPDEKALCESIKGMMKTNSINSCGRLTLSELISIMDRFKLFISNDTGPMHIAAAQGTPTIGLFGPETPKIFGPFGEKNVAVTKSLRCSPCIKIYEGQHLKCNNPNCMRAITVEEVFKHVEKMMK